MDPRPLLFHKIMIHFSYANTLVAIWYHTIQTLTKQGSGLWRLHFIYCWYLSIGSPWQSIHSPRQHLDSRVNGNSQNPRHQPWRSYQLFSPLRFLAGLQRLHQVSYAGDMCLLVGRELLHLSFGATTSVQNS